MPRPRRSQRKSKPAAKAAGSGGFTCPECGKVFSRAAALGAHRSRAHGVAGSSRSARSAGARRSPARTRTLPVAQDRSPAARNGGQSATGSRGRIDRDALLQQLFPNGLPAREAVIREANDWLDQAERLARMK